MHYTVETTGGGSTVWATSVPWTRRLSWRERLRYLWTAIRGKETIR